MNVNGKYAQTFLNSIVTNTQHTLSSLSEILGIPVKKLIHVNKLSEQDFVKINDLRQLLLNIYWLK